VQVTGAIRAGDTFDPASKRGLSLVAAFTMNGGSAKANRTQLAGAEEDLGLTAGAFLKFEPGLTSINFRTSCLSRDLSSQLNGLAAALKEPALQDADVERAKQNALTYVKQQEDSASYRVDRALLRSQISANSVYYPLSPADKAKSINSLKTQDLKEFFSSSIVPSATTLVIVGDVYAENLFSMIDKTFGTWISSEGKAKSIPAVQPNEHKILKSSIPVQDKANTMVRLGRLLQGSEVVQADPNYVHLLIADCALTNHPLFARLLRAGNADEKLAATPNFLSDDLKSCITPVGNGVLWALSLPIDANTAPQTVAMIQVELKKFAHLGITAEELAEVKRYLTGSLAVQQMSSITDASRSILETSLANEHASYLPDITLKVRSTTLDGINKFIKTEFKPDQASLVIAGTRQAMHDVGSVRTKDMSSH
jgi:predicted Zn-dependent peptidase